MHLICREESFCQEQAPEPILSEERGGGWIFNYSPFGAPLQFDWTKLAHAQLGYGAYNIRP